MKDDFVARFTSWELGNTFAEMSPFDLMTLSEASAPPDHPGA